MLVKLLRGQCQYSSGLRNLKLALSAIRSSSYFILLNKTPIPKQDPAQYVDDISIFLNRGLAHAYCRRIEQAQSDGGRAVIRENVHFTNVSSFIILNLYLASFLLLNIAE